MKTILCCLPMIKALANIDIFIADETLVRLVLGGNIKFCPYCGKKIKVESND